MKYPRIWIAAHGGPLEAAQLHDAPLEVLYILATFPHKVVRRHVAQNPSTSVKLLELLATDEDVWVLKRVVENRHSPVALLRKAWESAQYNPNVWVVLVALGKSSRTPEDILRELAVSDSVVAREAAAANPNMPEDVLRALWEDVEQVVQKEAYDNLDRRGLLSF